MTKAGNSSGKRRGRKGAREDIDKKEILAWWGQLSPVPASVGNGKGQAFQRADFRRFPVSYWLTEYPNAYSCLGKIIFMKVSPIIRIWCSGEESLCIVEHFDTAFSCAWRKILHPSDHSQIFLGYFCSKLSHMLKTLQFRTISTLTNWNHSKNEMISKWSEIFFSTPENLLDAGQGWGGEIFWIVLYRSDQGV